MSDVIATDGPCGRGRHRVHRLGERASERTGWTHTSRPTAAPVSVPSGRNTAVAYDDRSPAGVVLARRQPCRRRGIGDDDGAFAEGVEGQGQGLGAHVHQVGDDADEHSRTRQCDSGQSWLQT